jgi:hypothetical protein
MSGLAALLAGHNPPDVNVVEHAVEHAGWQFLYLDAWAIEDKTSFLKGMASTLELTDDLGENFDLLSDRLADVECGDKTGVVLLWEGWSPFARADEQAFHVALSVLGGRANADRGCAFAVLLRGEGPMLDVPELPAKHV